MSKVRIFSRFFPKGHPKEGQQTFFVEKIYSELGVGGNYLNIPLPDVDNFLYNHDENYFDAKLHTIRAGKHFKDGDYFSPRVWTDKPYRSKQIKIADDIKLERVFDFKIEIDKDYICVLIDNYPFYEENSRMVTQVQALETLAKNDGLSIEDFKSWFKWGKEPFDGQILCWSKSVEY